jgi:hypothetical protein
MRQQFIDPVAGMRVDARQHVAQVGPRVQAVELGRLHQAHHHGRALASQLAAHEQPVLRAQLPGLDLPLDEVVVDGHRAVIQVQRQRLPGVQAVVDRLGDLAAVEHLPCAAA